MRNIKDYRYINNWCVPMYSYIEGQEHQEYWVDSQNCEYYFLCNEKYIEKHNLKEKKWWLITPMIDKNIEKITEENRDTVEVFYFVDFSSEEADINKEFDMDNNKIIK